MKKNNMLRIASVLLVAVLMSTCAISGAFAKYTTSGTATDSARVAKFVNAPTLVDMGLFALSETGTVNAVADAYTVFGGNSNATNLVAPGTSGSATGFTFTGTAEVAVAISYTAEITLDDWTTTGSDVYCPIIFTVGTTDYEWDGSETAAEFAGRVAAAVAAVPAQEIAANTAISTATTPTISWRWAFDEADLNAADNQTNAKDTLLGQAGTAPTIEINLTAHIDQID